MKTTLDIPDALLEEARVAARERGTTLRELVTAGLRTELAEQKRGPVQPFRMPVFDGDNGVQAGVDLSDWDSVRSLIYGRFG